MLALLVVLGHWPQDHAQISVDTGVVVVVLEKIGCISTGMRAASSPRPGPLRHQYFWGRCPLPSHALPCAPRRAAAPAPARLLGRLACGCRSGRCTRWSVAVRNARPSPSAGAWHWGSPDRGSMQMLLSVIGAVRSPAWSPLPREKKGSAAVLGWEASGRSRVLCPQTHAAAVAMAMCHVHLRAWSVRSLPFSLSEEPWPWRKKQSFEVRSRRRGGDSAALTGVGIRGAVKGENQRTLTVEPEKVASINPAPVLFQKRKKLNTASGRNCGCRQRGSGGLAAEPDLGAP
jgi:hypothetical protein